LYSKDMIFNCVSISFPLKKKKNIYI